jgi:ribosomal protein L16 Arg81 hydroxylase
MIIRKEIKINDDTLYQNYSDKNVYIRNKENGILWRSVNSSIDFEYEETDKPIEEEKESVV